VGTKKSGAERGATESDVAKIVSLRDQHGLSFPAIAARLSIDRSVVGRLYRQAKAGVAS